MTSYRYLGYGTTDANGVAHLTKNASGQDVNGYVGTGAGEVDVIASLDNPISQGSIVSETLPVLDATFFDKGILNDPQTTDVWYNQQNASLTRASEYSEITENGGTAILRLKSANSIDKTSICVEFDVWVDNVNENFMSFANTTVGTYKGAYKLSEMNLQAETWNHIKLEVDSNGVVTPNGITSAQKTLDFNTEKMVFAFLTNGAITKVRFKNWCVYPI